MCIARSRISISPSHGFTLLELVVVRVILGLLAGYVAPKYFTQIGKSEVKTAKAQVVALENASVPYRHRAPSQCPAGSGCAETKPADEPRWDGPYLK